MVGFPCYILAQHTDSQGRKQGVWIKYDAVTGDLLYRGTFADDRPVGTFTFYYPGEQIKSILHYKLDGKIIYAKLFHPEGTKMAIGKYVGREIRDSVWSFYDINGAILSVETYRYGKKHGPSVVYLQDGTKSREIIYRNDTLNGPVVEYLDGTQIKFKGFYKNGVLEGEATYYRTDGTISTTGHYRNGIRDGFWMRMDKKTKSPVKEFYLNGQLLTDSETRAHLEQLKKAKAPKSGSKTPVKTPSKRKS
jgi:antitoxin component YwqK of YwqJK toxin-antitoxin module